MLGDDNYLHCSSAPMDTQRINLCTLEHIVASKEAKQPILFTKIWEGRGRVFLQIMQLCSAELAIFSCRLIAGYSRLNVFPKKEEFWYFFIVTESWSNEFRIRSWIQGGPTPVTSVRTTAVRDIKKFICKKCVLILFSTHRQFNWNSFTVTKQNRVS